MSEKKQAGREMIERVTGQIDYFLDLRGLPGEDISALTAAVKNVMMEYRNEEIKIPDLNQEQGREQLKARIRAEYNGCNMAEILERYPVSRRTVYRWCGE